MSQVLALFWRVLTLTQWRAPQPEFSYIQVKPGEKIAPVQTPMTQSGDAWRTEEDTWAGSCQITRLLQSKGFIIWPDSFGWCRPAVRWYTTFNFRKRSRRSVPVSQGQSHLRQEVTAVVNLVPPFLHTSSTCRRSSHREMWAFVADERRCTRVQTMTQTQKNQLPFVAMVTV